ncbi:MAG TPA: hypothetical protein VGF56_05765 [Rhizomicrobium sp.]|jgi:hypothetical protein
MSAFGVMLATLFSDPNLGMDIVYCPAAGGAIACRGAYAQPDIETQIQSAQIRDRKRVLLVRACDIAQPADNDTVQVPAGSAPFRLLNFNANDPMRLTWRLELAPQ